jgi:subtilase family serine protease
MNPQKRSSEPIRAHVVLKGKAGGLTAADEPISPENVEAYTASPRVREQVRTQLENLGFSVQHVSPLSIAVEATPEQLENTFDGQLEKIENPNQPASTWRWSKSPKIPGDLSDKVDTVVLPQPTRIVSSG